MKVSLLAFKKRNWDSRSAQERNILKLLFWGFTPVLIYFIFWLPAHTAVQKLNDVVPVMQIQLEKLRSQSKEVEMLRHLPKPALLDAAAMKITVEAHAMRHGLGEAVSTLELQPPNAVSVSFASVSFEVWLHWLRALQQEQHIRADAVSVARLPQSGMVKISATLVNGGNR